MFHFLQKYNNYLFISNNIFKVFQRYNKLSSLQPLHGIKVLDFSRILAGPYCTQALSDLGADIIKVEIPEKGDDTRKWGPPFINGESTYFMSINRNKKSITIDIKHPEGLNIIKDLVKHCEVVVENFIPGKTKQLGIDYEELKKVNESIIYGSITGFGNSGPSSTRRGYDVMLSALGGLMSITGESDGPPVKVGVALTDVITGLWIKSTICSALLYKYKTGKGSYIECSLLDAQISSLVNIASAYLNANIIGKRWGTAHPSIVPYQAFEVKDGYIVLGANNDIQWERLCNVINKPHLIKDPKYISNEQRVSNRKELIDTIQQELKLNTKKYWEEVLGKANLPVCSVNNLKEVFEEPQVIHNNIVQELIHPKSGKIKLTKAPIKINGERPSITTPPPILGQHTEEILKNTLKYTDKKIEYLKKEKII